MPHDVQPAKIPTAIQQELTDLKSHQEFLQQRIANLLQTRAEALDALAGFFEQVRRGRIGNAHIRAHAKG